jgi:hypothetical protein
MSLFSRPVVRTKSANRTRMVAWVTRAVQYRRLYRACNEGSQALSSTRSGLSSSHRGSGGQCSAYAHRVSGRSCAGSTDTETKRMFGERSCISSRECRAVMVGHTEVHSVKMKWITHTRVYRWARAYAAAERRGWDCGAASCGRTDNCGDHLGLSAVEYGHSSCQISLGDAP